MQPFVLIYIDTILSRKHDLSGPIFKIQVDAIISLNTLGSM